MANDRQPSVVELLERWKRAEDIRDHLPEGSRLGLALDQDVQTTYLAYQRRLVQDDTAQPDGAEAGSQAGDAVEVSYRLQAQVVYDRWREIQRQLEYGVGDSALRDLVNVEAARLWDERRRLVDLARAHERPPLSPSTEPAA